MFTNFDVSVASRHGTEVRHTKQTFRAKVTQLYWDYSTVVLLLKFWSFLI